MMIETCEKVVDHIKQMEVHILDIESAMIDNLYPMYLTDNMAVQKHPQDSSKIMIIDLE